uniref:Arf-GAP domain-containing protein n=1 Tax=Sphenodon punctatus TaxID=8508 RepID=A0A8D0G590_SPHPU
MARERNKKALQELLRGPGNAQCADCSAPDPDWASHTLGVFICLNCSGLHRNIPHISKVKSVQYPPAHPCPMDSSNRWNP